MDKQTLSQYGWVVIAVLILSVMIAMATPFGTFVANGFKASYNGLFDVQTNALGVIIAETSETTIPEGGVYYVGVTSTTPGDYTGHTAKYETGAKFPETVSEGDVYVYQNYEYRYNRQYRTGAWRSYSGDGWGVYCINDVTNPGAILTAIAGKQIKMMSYTFDKCDSLEVAPLIPEGVISIYSAFYGCANLRTYEGSTDPDGDFSNYILPHGMEIISFAYGRCLALTVAPYIPETVTSVDQAFYSPPKNPILTGKLYVPCHISDYALTYMFYDQSTVEVVRYCISTCTGCANCHFNCGH